MTFQASFLGKFNLHVLLYLLKAQPKQQSLPHPGEVRWLRSSHKHLNTVKLRRRGDITFLRPCRKLLLGIRLVMVSGPVHNLRRFLSPSLSQGWVIFSAEAARIGSSSWAVFLWPQWPLPWRFLKEFWLTSVLGGIFIADERISNIKAGAGKHRF